MRLSVSRDGGLLKLLFEGSRQLINSWTPVQKIHVVLALEPGMVLKVLYDPGYPTRGIVKPLYQLRISDQAGLYATRPMAEPRQSRLPRGAPLHRRLGGVSFG